MQRLTFPKPGELSHTAPTTPVLSHTSLTFWLVLANVSFSLEKDPRLRRFGGDPSSKAVRHTSVWRLRTAYACRKCLFTPCFHNVHFSLVGSTYLFTPVVLSSLECASRNYRGFEHSLFYSCCVQSDSAPRPLSDAIILQELILAFFSPHVFVAFLNYGPSRGSK